MANKSGGGGLGWFIIGAAVGAAAVYWGPSQYQQYVQNKPAGQVRMEVEPTFVPGQWQRRARFEIAFSARKANGQNWDWPMVEPELQLCVREGGELRKCYGPLDPVLAACKGQYRCVTGPIMVPNVPFTVELNEWDDYNKPDPIGEVPCDIGQTCKFPLGVVSVRDAGGI